MQGVFELIFSNLGKDNTRQDIRFFFFYRNLLSKFTYISFNSSQFPNRQHQFACATLCCMQYPQIERAWSYISSHKMWTPDVRILLKTALQPRGTKILSAVPDEN